MTDYTELIARLRELADEAKPWRNVNIVKPATSDESGAAIIGAELDGEFYPCVEIDCDQYYADSKPLADYLAAMNEHGLTLLDALQAQAERIKAQDSEIERLNHKDKMITKWTENGELVEREAQGAVPVAWRYVSANGVYRYCKHRPNRDMAKEYAILEPVPLYTHAPNAWFDGYNAAVKDAVNKGVYEDGKHVGFLAKSSADSVGEYYLVQFSAPPESTAQAAPKDELGDLRSALWLSDEALKLWRRQ